MPDLTERWAEFQKLKNETYQNLRKRQREHDDLYWQIADIGLDPEYFGKAIWRPTAMKIIEGPADHIAMDRIKVNAEPRLGARGIETKGTQEEADKKEKWVQRVLDVQRRNEPYFLRELVKSLAWHGEGYLKWLFDEGALEKPEDYEGCPFTFEVPNSRMVYSTLDMKGGIPYLVYEEKVVYLSLVKRRLLEWNEDKGLIKTVLEGFESQDLKDSQLVSFIEWWTPDERGYIVGNSEGKPIGAVPISNDFVVDNPHGYVPYARGFSGRGIWPEDGDPGKIAVGLLTGLEKTLILQTRLATQINTITSKLAAPTPVATLAPDHELTKEESSINVGVILQERQDRVMKWRFENPPPLPPNLLQEMQLVDSTLEGYLPGITRGEGTPGEPASSAATRYATASLIWEPQMIAAKKLIAVVLGMCLRCVDELIKAPIELTPGLKLGPDDIQGQYEVSVSIESGDPEQKRWDYLLGKDMAGELPQEMIIEKFYHESDASGIIVKLIGERLLNQLMSGGQLNDYQRRVAQDVFEKIGLENALAGLPASTVMQQGILGGQPMGGPQTPQGVGGSPTRGVPPLASPAPAEPVQMQKMRVVEGAMSGLR